LYFSCAYFGWKTGCFCNIFLLLDGFALQDGDDDFSLGQLLKAIVSIISYMRRAARIPALHFLFGIALKLDLTGRRLKGFGTFKSRMLLSASWLVGL